MHSNTGIVLDSVYELPDFIAYEYLKRNGENYAGIIVAGPRCEEVSGLQFDEIILYGMQDKADGVLHTCFLNQACFMPLNGSYTDK